MRRGTIVTGVVLLFGLLALLSLPTEAQFAASAWKGTVTTVDSVGIADSARVADTSHVAGVADSAIVATASDSAGVAARLTDSAVQDSLNVHQLRVFGKAMEDTIIVGPCVDEPTWDPFYPGAPISPCGKVYVSESVNDVDTVYFNTGWSGGSFLSGHHILLGDYQSGHNDIWSPFLHVGKRSGEMGIGVRNPTRDLEIGTGELTLNHQAEASNGIPYDVEILTSAGANSAAGYLDIHYGDSYSGSKELYRHEVRVGASSPNTSAMSIWYIKNNISSALDGVMWIDDEGHFIINGNASDGSAHPRARALSAFVISNRADSSFEINGGVEVNGDIAHNGRLVGARASFDTLEGNLVGLWGEIADTLANYPGPVRFDNVESITVRADSATVGLLDTTWTATSSSKLIAVNMHNPNQMGWYKGTPPRLTSSLQAFRTAELNNSLWRDSGLRWPDYWIGTITDGGDSLEVWDLVSGIKVKHFRRSENMPNVAMNDVAFMDGSIYLATDAGANELNLWSDQRRRWTTNGSYVSPLPLSLMDASTTVLISSTPAVVNNTAYAIAVTRSPFLGAAGQDVFGRQRPYWVVGTDGGASAANYSSEGTLRVYDSQGTSSRIGVFVLPTGAMSKAIDGSTDQVHWVRSIFSFTSDSWDENASFDYDNSAGQQIPFGQSAAYQDAVMLNGRSGSGRNSPSVYAAASNGGLAIIDVKPSDSTNGMKQVITNTYVSPVLAGDVVVAFSPASSAQLVTSDVFSTAYGDAPTTVAASSGPLSHSWRFAAGDTLWMNIANPDSVEDAWEANGFTLLTWIKSDSLLGEDEDQLLNIADRIVLYAHTDDHPWFRVFNSDKTGSYSRKPTGWPITGWNHLAIRWTGGTGSGGITFYVNGQSADVTTISSTVIDSLEFSTTPAFMTGTAVRTQPVITNTQLTAAEIRAIYERGRKFIESPTPDTLYGGGDVDFIAADPIGQRIILGDETHVEIRDASGALIDTLRCTECGTIADATFMSWPWADSLSVAFGGSGGIRYKGVHPRFVDMSNAEWPLHSEFIIHDEAVVDSAGTGHFWTVQDAISALGNVGKRAIRVLSGTYNDPVTSVSDGMTLTGQGAGTLVTNVNSTTDEPITVSGDSVTIRDMRFSAAGAGAGGGQDAILWSGSHGLAENVEVLDADDDGILINGTRFQGNNITVWDADDQALRLGASHSTIVASMFSSGVTTIVLTAASDSSRIVGSDVAGNIRVLTGAIGNAIIGTHYGTLEDYETVTEAGNP